MMMAGLFLVRALVVGVDDLGLLGAGAPVDEDDPDDDTGEKTDRGHAQGEVLTLGPADLLEGVAQARRGAVSAEEPDLDEGTGEERRAEDRREDEDGQEQADDVLAAGHGHTEGQVGTGEVDGLLEFGQALAEEEAREDHGDQQAGQGRPDRHDLFTEETARLDPLGETLGDALVGEQAREPSEDVGAEEQRDAATNDRTRQVELLRELPLHPDEFGDQQQTSQQEECETDGFSRHFYLSMRSRNG